MDRIRCVLDLQGAQSESRFRGIGRYSLDLALAIAKAAGEHEVWIALNGSFADSVAALLAKFDGLIPRERIVTFDVPRPVAESDPANSWRRRAAEHIREHFLATLVPDVVHISSIFEGFIDDAVTSIGVHNASFPATATFYDLIPLLLPDQYHCYPEVKEHYLRKAQSLKRADILLAISESARREAIEGLQIPEERVVNVSTGVDEQFRSIALSFDESSILFHKYAITRPFVMYSGAMDSRKNIAGLIEAFALLPSALRGNHHLVIVGRHDSSTRERMQILASNYGLPTDAVIFPGYISDDDLVALYNLCSLFVLPSFHEGFGLPALEAMACGAPTIASNVTSLPEVMGWEEAMFDPKQPNSIADKMQKVLTDELFRDQLRQNGFRQCTQFTWERSAKIAWSAFEELHRRRRSVREYVFSPIITAERPRMAYFSPLPPERSGISDYSAELLPDLARYYDIEVVVEQNTVDDDWVAANFPVRTVSEFERCISKYDRILYQIGNSPFHTYMLDTLRLYPGTVVLHDFFLSGVLNWMETLGGLPGHFSRELFDSHGYLGLLEEKKSGREWAVRNFPCNRRILEAAAGVIVHSAFSRQLAEQWYGRGTALDWRLVPFVRSSKPHDRDDARTRLGIAREDYLVCSFGLVDPTKLTDRLLSAWLRSQLVSNGHCHLVIVGENNLGDYGRQLLSRIAKSDAGGRIRITGFAPPTTYKDYLSAADCAVQLRIQSRGETSAAVQDCLAYGVPTIINAHGSFGEVPEAMVRKLPDVFTDAELCEALEQMYFDPSYREELSQSSSKFMRAEHHPSRVAKLYRDAIESFTLTHPVAVEERLLAAIASTPTSAKPTPRDLIATSRSIATQRRRGTRQLMLDVSATARNDLKTGIERVARNLSRELMQNPHAFRVEPVRIAEGQRLYAREFALRMMKIRLELDEPSIDFRAGDVYLALDWCPEAVCESRQFFAELRAHNVPIYFVVYDLLPILQPEKFPQWAASEFQRWLDTVCEVSDGLACISRSVADELVSWLDHVQPARLRPLSIGYFHLGAEIEEGSSEQVVPPSCDGVLSALRAHPSILMVGTIEPRKGHAQVLAAFERLWAEGIKANLVIVGQQGWDVESLIDMISRHSESGKRLLWLSSASDEMLSWIYSQVSGLLAASEGEGFGLPLIEAARHKVPIIARNIPVFRELAAQHAFYFEGNAAESLAASLRTWLELRSKGQAPSSDGLRWLSWKESAQQVMEIVEGSRVYQEWLPSAANVSSPGGKPHQENPKERVERCAAANGRDMEPNRQCI